MGEGRTRRPGKIKKALRQGVSTVVRLAATTMGQSQSHDLTPLSSVYPLQPPPHSLASGGGTLRFHRVHGDNIRLEADGARARRVDSFCNGILFTHRPVAVGERVCLRICDLSSRWNGVIRLGFTSHDPSVRAGTRLPKYACPDLTSLPGFWAKALSERYSEAGALISYFVAGNGDVHFGINGKDRGVFFSGVDTRRPLWAMVDLYGNCTGIELVDLVRSLNNNQRRQQLQQLQQQVHVQAQLSALVLDPPPPRYIPPPPPSSSSQPPPQQQQQQHSPDFLPLRYNQHASFRPMSFHFCTGRHARLTEGNTAAARHEEEFAQGYVFTASSIRFGERLVVQVLSTEDSYIGSLAFGLTNCDPSTIDTRELPEDSDQLLDRPEYWVVSKDVGNGPQVGDELSFLVRPDGTVEFSRNMGPPSPFMHVDASLKLWAFWDVYGNTSKIRILGSTVTPAIVPMQPPQSLPAPPVRGAEDPAAAAATATLVSLATNAAAANAGMGEQPLATECIVCQERPVDAVIYSCGHLCMCMTCAVQQWKGRGGGFCPICRENIRDVIKTFRS